jgi:hypothetical protein
MKEDLSTTVSLDGKSVTASQFADLFTGPLRCMSQLVNLMARIKSLITDLPIRSLKLHINMAVGCLQDDLYDLENTCGVKIIAKSFSSLNN